MTRTFAVTALFAVAIAAGTAPEAHARDYQYAIIKYHVQVKYRFANTGYYRWRTQFSTTNRNLAYNYLDILLDLKDDGLLNEAVTGGSDKWIAVDARVIWTAESDSSYRYRWGPVREGLTEVDP